MDLPANTVAPEPQVPVSSPPRAWLLSGRIGPGAVPGGFPILTLLLAIGTLMGTITAVWAASDPLSPETSGFILLSGAVLIGLLALFLFLTRRSRDKDLEARVRECTAELEDKIRDLETFAFSVIHDLRAPLRTIEGFSQAVMEDCGTRMGPEGLAHMQRIHRASRQMEQIIEDMTSLAKVTGEPLRRDKVDLGDMAREILDGLRRSESGRVVTVEIQEGLTVEGDGGLIRSMLSNLLSNAWKFTSRKAEARIEIGRLRQEDQEVFFVRDNGAGFDMAFQDKLFKTFNRLHEAQEFAGTGIGLAIVDRVVRRHGGRAWAESQEGKGATFFFTLTAGGDGMERQRQRP